MAAYHSDPESKTSGLNLVKKKNFWHGDADIGLGDTSEVAEVVYFKGLHALWLGFSIIKGESMFDLNPLTAISREVREWMGWIESNNKAREESVRTALKSLSIAVLETRSYLAQLSTESRGRDLAKEQAISNLWHEATLDLQSVDRALAERCFAKAEYWVDPTKWDADKIQRYNITLESMSNAVRELLSKSRRA